MSAELWVCDVESIVADAGCVAAVLVTGNKRIALRMSRHTLVKVSVMAHAVLAGAKDAEVKRFPRKKH